jgi:alanine racemase
MTETQAALPRAALRLKIDRDALRANWRMLDTLSGTASAGAAVKANAYGLGVAVAVPELHAAGCRDFYVAHPGEVRELLGLLDPATVGVLHGPLHDEDAAWLHGVGVKPVINSVAQARRWLQAGGGRCDLMVDTGINRLGLPMTELGDEAIAKLEIDVLLSHLASAEEASSLNAQQLDRWQSARRAVRHRRASLANSAGITLGADYHGDLTRPGLALYGGIACAALAGSIRQVVRPQAAIMQVRQIEPGDSIGYNATYVAERAMRVATIALGYADGYLRCWSGKGLMSAGGLALPVLGRVSMDMTVVDITNAPSLREGDWLEANYYLPDAAAASGLSQYELLTLLGARFAR